MSRVSAIVLAILALEALSSPASMAASEIPTAISYQGRLADSSGAAVPDGTYKFQFKLYTVASGGSAFWTSSSMQLQTTGGLFTARLENLTPATLAGKNDFYLETCVGDPATTLAPRVKLASTPFALRAADLALPFSSSMNSLADMITLSNSGNGNLIAATTSGGGRCVDVSTSGSGEAICAVTSGTNNAGWFVVLNSANANSAVNAYTSGTGSAIKSTSNGTGRAGYFQISSVSNTSAAIEGTTAGTGQGVVGTSPSASGQLGGSYGAYGKHTSSGNSGYLGGSSMGAYGAYGSGNNYGALGLSSAGAYGTYSSLGNYGYLGTSSAGVSGVAGSSVTTGRGVSGLAYGGSAIGVYGQSSGVTGYGVFASASGASAQAMHAEATSPTGVGIEARGGAKGVSGIATSASSIGVYGESNGDSGRAVSALASGAGAEAIHAEATGSGGTGIYARAGSGGLAAQFSGNVRLIDYSTSATVIELGTGLDYAEGFRVTRKDKVAPGCVLVIDQKNPGKLTQSSKAYDRRVAGIVAGAKNLGSGVRLGVDGFDHNVALAGRVYCNVDATKSAIQPGDLLTTSSIAGYAMKATDHSRSQGAILGKAMESLAKGKRGQILVLVTLQ